MPCLSLGDFASASHRWVHSSILGQTTVFALGKVVEGFFSGYFGFPSQYHSTFAPQSPLINACFIRTSGRNFGTFKAMHFRIFVEHWRWFSLLMDERVFYFRVIRNWWAEGRTNSEIFAVVQFNLCRWGCYLLSCSSTYVDGGVI